MLIGGLYQIPEVAVEIFEDRYDTIGFPGWLPDETDIFGPHLTIIPVTIIGE
jgi:hypothetical protein